MNKFFWCSMIFLLTLTGCENIEKNRNIQKIDRLKSAVSVGNMQMVASNLDASAEYLIEAISLDNLEVASLILENFSTEVYEGNSPFFYVKSLEALELLLDKGFEVNVLNDDFENLVEYYIKNRPLSFAKQLLRKSDKLRNFPVFLMAIKGDEELIELAITRGADFTEINSEGNYPIYYSTDENIILKLLDLKYDVKLLNKNNENILGEVYLKSKEQGRNKIVQKLLKKGVNPNYTSYNNIYYK